MLKSVSLGDVECDYGSIDLLIERLTTINTAAKAKGVTEITVGTSDGGVLFVEGLRPETKEEKHEREAKADSQPTEPFTIGDRTYKIPPVVMRHIRALEGEKP